jgi:hypothetical protein
MFNFLYSSDARTELLRSLIHSLATALLPRMNIIATYVYHNVIINVQQRLNDERHHASPSTWYRSILLLATNASRLHTLAALALALFEFGWSNNVSLCKHAQPFIVPSRDYRYSLMNKWNTTEYTSHDRRTMHQPGLPGHHVLLLTAAAHSIIKFKSHE